MSTKVPSLVSPSKEVSPLPFNRSRPECLHIFARVYCFVAELMGRFPIHTGTAAQHIHRRTSYAGEALQSHLSGHCTNTHRFRKNLARCPYLMFGTIFLNAGLGKNKTVTGSEPKLYRKSTVILRKATSKLSDPGASLEGHGVEVESSIGEEGEEPLGSYRARHRLHRSRKVLQFRKSRKGNIQVLIEYS